MEIDESRLRDVLRRILAVEREHMFGASSGSQSARRRELEREIERVLADLKQQPRR
jgi:hypothetical protein